MGTPLRAVPDRSAREPHFLRDPVRNWFPHIDCFAHMLGKDVPWRQHFNYLTETAEKENPASYTGRKVAS